MPAETAITRSWSAAATILARLKAMRLPLLSTSRSTSTRATSRASSRIWSEAITGAGTASSSPRYGSGHAMQSGAAITPPCAFRMSWRSGMVSFSTPASRRGVSLLRYR